MRRHLSHHLRPGFRSVVSRRSLRPAGCFGQSFAQRRFCGSIPPLSRLKGRRPGPIRRRFGHLPRRIRRCVYLRPDDRLSCRLLSGRRLRTESPAGRRIARLRHRGEDRLLITPQLRLGPPQKLAADNPQQEDGCRRGNPRSVNPPSGPTGGRSVRFRHVRRRPGSLRIQGVEFALQPFPTPFGGSDFGIAQGAPHLIGPIGMCFHLHQCVSK